MLFFFFFLTAPVAYGSSWAKDQIWLCHCCDLCHSGKSLFIYFKLWLVFNCINWKYCNLLIHIPIKGQLGFSNIHDECLLSEWINYWISGNKESDCKACKTSGMDSDRLELIVPPWLQCLKDNIQRCGTPRKFQAQSLAVISRLWR